MNTLNMYHKIYIWPVKWKLLKWWYIKQTVAFHYRFTACMFSHSVVSDSLWPHGLQQARLPCSLPSPRVCSNSCPLSRWCHPTLSSSVACSSSSCLQSFPASGSFSVSQLFTSSGHSIGASASASVLVNIQGWFPLRWTGLISLQSKGLSRVFSSTTILKHQFFGTQPSLWSNSHIHTWLLEKLWLYGSLSAKQYLFFLIHSLGLSPLGWTGWISLRSKGLSRVFSNATVQKHQFFSAQLSSQSNSHIHTWPLEKP